MFGRVVHLIVATAILIGQGLAGSALADSGQRQCDVGHPAWTSAGPSLTLAARPPHDPLLDAGVAPAAFRVPVEPHARTPWALVCRVALHLVVSHRGPLAPRPPPHA